INRIEIPRSAPRRTADALRRHAADAVKSLFPDRRKDLPFSLNVFGMGFDLSQMEQADLIHLHWIGGRTLDFSRLGRIRRPLVHTLHDLFACTAGCHCPLECTGFHEGCRGKCPQLGTPRLFPGLPAWLFDRKKKAFGSIRSLTLVTPSRWLRQQVEKSCMFPGRRIVQIYNPVDTEIFHPAEDRQAKRKQMGINPEAFVIACGATGLFNPVKGGRFIPLILDELHRRGHRNIHLILFGSQEKSPNFPYACTSMGFITDARELAALYSTADIFLNPSLQDVLPNVALESISCKTPSVTFRTGGIPEVVLDGLTGLIADQGDVRAMANHCERLMLDRKLLHSLAEEGRKHAERVFSYSVIAERHAKLYEETLREFHARKTENN
uniref:glycosyltransferase n=1 Tax=Akkermansia sp. TaxID=1872421 RepID=UPI003A847F56